MGLFTSKRSAQMAGKRGTMTAKEAKAKAQKENNPSEFKRRQQAARARGKSR